MKPKGNILDKIDRRDGLTVPDGYFADFAKRMASQLPDAAPAAAPAVSVRTNWQRWRPYVYMAAMFAGIWCMLYVFNLISNNGTDLSIEANPGLASAASNEQFIEDYVIDDVPRWDLYDEMVADSVDFYTLIDSAYNADPSADNVPQ